MRLHLSLLLILSIFSFSIHAAESELKMVSTISVIEENSSQAERLEVATFMQSENVQKELIKQGVNPKEALSRLATLSNAEVKSLADQIKAAKAGGDFGVGGIIGVFVFLFIVLLITDILGFTKVFPFTRAIQ